MMLSTRRRNNEGEQGTEAQDRSSRYKYHVNILSGDGKGPESETAMKFCHYFLSKFESPTHPVFYPARDHLGGESYFEVIRDVLNSSKFTVVVLTKGNRGDAWLQYTQQVAHMHSLKGKSHHLIPVTIGVPEEDIPQEYRAVKVIKFDEDFERNHEEWELLRKSIWRSDDQGFPVELKCSVEKLTAALKHCYLREFDKVRFLPWDATDCLPLSEVYVRLAYEKGYMNNQEKILHYCDMFSKTPDRINPHQIFVLGEPGVGKSTFSKKIALDWSTGVVPALKRFKIVLTVFLRTHYFGERIENTICRELLPRDKGFDARELREVMKALGKECLLVLDGLDELKNWSEDLKSVVENKSLEDATIIITTRPVGSDAIKHADVRAKILGFAPTGVDRYIDKFFTIVEAPTLQQLFMVEIKRRGFHEMSRVPLLLHLLCVLYYNMKQLPETLTGVYGKITKYIIMRYKSVKSGMGDTVNDEELQLAIDKLRKLAYDALISGHLMFDEDELKMALSRDMLEIGFLSYWDIPRKLEKSKQLTFLHKSFQEYFAVEYIVLHYDRTEELWQHCNTEGKVLALKQMFGMCCGLSPDIGVQMLRKIQEMDVMDDEDLCELQVELLCEVTDPVDISALHCYTQLYIELDHAPIHVHFKPTLIDVRGNYNTHVHRFELDSLTVSFKDQDDDDYDDDDDDDDGVSMCTDQLQEIRLQGCQLDSAACQSLYNMITLLHSHHDNSSHVGAERGEQQHNVLKLHVCGGDIEDMSVIVRCATHTTYVHTLDVLNETVDLSVALSGAVQPSSLHTLQLCHCSLSSADVRALFSWPHVHQLTELDLSYNQLNDTLCAALSGAAQTFSLHSLRLIDCKLSSADVHALFSWPHVHQLTELDLSHNQLGGTLSVVLSGAAQASSLHILRLCNCKLSSIDVCALFSWPHVHQLTELDLSRNQLSDTLCAALSGCHQELSLRTLCMQWCGLTGEDVKVLAQWLRWAPYLDELDLMATYVCGEELQPLQEVLATRQLGMRIRFHISEQELHLLKNT